jgi:hypothetical protein
MICHESGSHGKSKDLQVSKAHVAFECQCGAHVKAASQGTEFQPGLLLDAPMAKTDLLKLLVF